VVLELDGSQLEALTSTKCISHVRDGNLFMPLSSSEFVSHFVRLK
jgi:hypothetical protein